MKNRYLILTVLIIILATSCSKSILDKVNPNQVTVDQYYQNANQLTLATNGVYAILLGSNLFARNWNFFEDCLSDEVSAGGGQTEVGNVQLLNGSFDNSNGTLNGAWTGFYRVIHRANGVIEFGPKVVGMDASLQKRLIGEAKFLRAWSYFELVTHWGKVPLYTETVKTPDGAKPLSDESEIYALLKTDLTAIQADLPKSYSGNDIGRVTSGAAQMLLARCFMHQGMYAEAQTELLKIYNSGVYSLVDNYSDNFIEETEYNKESIFEVGFMGDNFGWANDGDVTGAKASCLAQDYGPTGWRNVIPSDQFLNDYERPFKGDPKEDPRLRSTVYFTGDTYGSPSDPKILTAETQNGYSSNFNGVIQKISWKKWTALYKVDQGGYYSSNINFRMMRFAEVLLKLAECENELGTGAKALSYLNQLRDRPSVKMPHYPTARYTCTNKDEILHAIMHESRIELGGDKVRGLEILRWRKNGKLKGLDPDPISYIVANPTRALLPIPNSETSANPNIK